MLNNNYRIFLIKSYTCVIRLQLLSQEAGVRVYFTAENVKTSRTIKSVFQQQEYGMSLGGF